MASVNVKKRGKVYQYQLEVGKVNGKRKRISKSGFKTKIEDDKEDIKHVYSQQEIDAILDRFKNNDTFTCAFLTSCYT